MIGALAVLAAGFFFAAPAAQAATEGPYGGITCTDYPTQTGGWPTDNSHFKTCFSYTTQLANQIKSGGNGLSATAKNRLSSQNVNVYYFQNRSAANAFFAANPDYTNAPMNVFQSNSARCGQTGHFVWQDLLGQNHHRIAIAIYEDCSFDAGPTTNPDRTKVMQHESGHAFAYAIAALNDKQSGPDISDGYIEVGDHDIDEIDTTGTVCQIFGSTMPSEFEINLGTPNDKVCVANTVESAYVGLDQGEIAEIRAPYFVGQSVTEYADLWAEQFSILAGGVGGNQGKFAVTDNILKSNRMLCSYWVVRSFYNTGEPVGPNNPSSTYQSFPTAYGCPNISEADQE